jgi:hypothetical protein
MAACSWIEQYFPSAMDPFAVGIREGKAGQTMLELRAFLAHEINRISLEEVDGKH